MAFELNDPRRTQPVWAAYPGVEDVRFLVKPRDPAVLEELARRYPIEERLTRRGRVAARSPKAAEAWVADYIVAHLVDWDGITMDGAKAPITAETVAKLTAGMRDFVFEVSAADEPGQYAGPLPAS